MTTISDELDTEYLQLRTVDHPALLRQLRVAIGSGENEVLGRQLANMEERICAIHHHLSESEAGPGVAGQRRPGSVQAGTLEVQSTLAELDRSTALQLLGEAKLGRLAFCMYGTPHIEPVNFVLVDGDPVFRVGVSSKLSAGLSGRKFALQADRIDERTHTGWAVTVSGPMHVVAREDGERLAAGLVPWAGGERPYVMRLTARQVFGRRLLGNCALARQD
jgi:hypothetical protein